MSLANSMSLEKLFLRKQRRIGQRYLNDAIEGIGHQDRPRKTPLALGAGLAVVVLLVPVFVALCGVSLIALKFPSVFFILAGLALCGVGYLCLPKRPILPKDTYTRQDLPEMFAKLDRIGADLGAPAPEAVRFTTEFSCSVQQVKSGPFGKTLRVLEIGLPLWCAAEANEKRAMLARALARMAVDDPFHKPLFWGAENLLIRFYLFISANAKSSEFGEKYFLGQTSALDEIQRREVVASPFMGLIRLAHVLLDVVVGNLVLLVLNVFVQIRFTHSQPAEYRAEALAAELVGASSCHASLMLIVRSPFGRRAMLDLFPFAKDQNGRIFDHMGAATRAAGEDEIDVYLKREMDAADQEASVQVPLGRLIAFQQALVEKGVNGTLTEKTGMDEVDAELTPIKDEIGRKLMQKMNADSANR